MTQNTQLNSTIIDDVHAAKVEKADRNLMMKAIILISIITLGIWAIIINDLAKEWEVIKRVYNKVWK